MFSTPQFRWFFTVFVSVLLLFASSLSFIPNTESAAKPPAPNESSYDIRSDASGGGRGLFPDVSEDAKTAQKTRSLAHARLKEITPGLTIEYGRELGVPEVIGAGPGSLGFVTTASEGKRPEILRMFVKQNAGLFGLNDREIDALRVSADYTNPDGNLSFVHLEQLIDGVPVFQGEIKAGFSRRGEIVRIINNIAPDLSADSLGRDFGEPEKATAEALKYTDFLPDPTLTTAGRLYFPLAPGAVRPAWRIHHADQQHSFYVIVDAETGLLLWRKNLAEDQAVPRTYEVYGNATSPMKTADSASPYTPGCPSPANCAQPLAVARQQFTLIGNEPPNTFNSLGWIPDGENRTIGNNAEAGIDRDGVQGIDPNGWAFADPLPPNPDRRFVYSYNPAPGIPPPGEEPLPTTQTYPPSSFQQGVITHAFYTANRWHDETYRLGFTEQARNFQADNFGRGGVGNDSISVEVQDSSGTNGANFSAPADGGRGRLQMSIWPAPVPDRDGGLDSQIIVHELTHGLSNRLHGNSGGLSSNMARGMGEGWSDFYALAMLSEPSDDPCGTNSIGGYVTYQILPGYEANYYYGIRRFPVARRACVGPNGLPHNPLTFRYINSDCNALIGTTTSDPPPNSAYPRGPIGTTTCDQIHNLGEFWSSVLWEVRGFLIDTHGAAEGNRRALQYVTDGMKLSPLNPTMIQSRDAIVAAAQATSPGDVIHVRRGFAARGIGFAASIQNAGTGSNNTAVTESFSSVNVVIGSGFAISDATGNNNGSFEPGERITITVPVTNNSGLSITGVSVHLSGGTTTDYGTIASGQTVTRDFVYTIPWGALCPGINMLTFNISGSEGGAVENRQYFVGLIANTATGANTTPVTITDNGASTPYGTSVTIAGIPDGGTKRIRVELTGLSHSFPADIDMLLVGPASQKFVFLSDSGGGTDVSNITMTLEDFAAAQPGEPWTAGSFRPFNSSTGDTFPTPAPAAPYENASPAGSATFASAFGQVAAGLNGTWTLFIVDDAATDGGTLTGGWKLSVDSVACTICFCGGPRARADFDGDGRSDFSVFRPNEGVWYMNRSTSGFSALNWGSSGDRIVPGDFDGDGRSDQAVFRPATDSGQPDFYVLGSNGMTYSGYSWGLPGDIPVVEDYDGDRKDDIAVYRPSNHTFYVRESLSGGVRIYSNIDVGTPAAGDFDGDGRADFATYTGDGWLLAKSGENYATVTFTRFGTFGDKPVQADYDGDGKFDFAVYRPSETIWYILKSSGGTRIEQFGLAADVPVAADYDGDGKGDIAVYRDGTWYVNRSTAGILITRFGLAGDVPIAAGYLP